MMAPGLSAHRAVNRALGRVVHFQWSIASAAKWRRHPGLDWLQTIHTAFPTALTKKPPHGAAFGIRHFLDQLRIIHCLAGMAMISRAPGWPGATLNALIRRSIGPFGKLRVSKL